MHWNFQAGVLLLHPATYIYISHAVNYSALLFHFLHMKLYKCMTSTAIEAGFLLNPPPSSLLETSTS